MSTKKHQDEYATARWTSVPPGGPPERLPSRTAHAAALALVGALTAVTLVLTAEGQLFDTNFYSLWQTTALLAGDHPYRDFFEWGVPLQVVVSLVAQLLSGHRVIGEFLVHWLFIVLGAVIATHLAIRLSRSLLAALVTALLVLPLAASTPIYHYPKLFFYPLAVWLSWRYMESPTAWRAVVLGIATAAAFLFRHDHGVYLGCASVLAFALTRITNPSLRSARAAVTEATAYTLSAALILSPWLIVVQINEGLPDYVRTRATRYTDQTPNESPFRDLLEIDAVQSFASDVLRFQRPSPNDALDWLYQMALAVPLLLLVAAAFEVIRSRRFAEAATGETSRMIMAAAFLVIVDSRIFREQTYVVVVAPLTAALAAPLLAGSTRGSRARAGRMRAASVARLALATGLVSMTAVSVVAFTRDSGVYNPGKLARELPDAFAQLMASPPIDGYQPADEVLQYDRDAWLQGRIDRNEVLLRYLHDCTAEGDRLLVTGSTPFQVGYYTNRPIAGGHLFWHEEWRSDSAHERQSLAMLQSQSVPFALSTTDPVLDDFKVYPRIRDYLVTHYVELEGSAGRLLIDTRRKPTGRYGRLGFPCFR